MFIRRCPIPDRSFFLFGPRGTGKSTWIRAAINAAVTYDLLDEVHRLIELRRLRFVLSGSSARKLRRGGTNLLAGRADMRRLYPLVSPAMWA